MTYASKTLAHDLAPIVDDHGWKKNRATTVDLFTKIIYDMKPHKTRETCSVNDAKGIILKTARLRAVFTQKIQETLKNIKAVQKELEEATELTAELEKKLYDDTTTLEQEKIDIPKTVCVLCADKKQIPTGK